MKPFAHRAFTLLETVVMMAALAVFVLILAGSMRHPNWELIMKGEAIEDAQGQARSEDGDTPAPDTATTE